jgi:hypothetical protein
MLSCFAERTVLNDTFVHTSMALESLMLAALLATHAPEPPVQYHREYALLPERPRLASEPLIVDLRKDPRFKGNFFGMPKYLKKDSFYGKPKYLPKHTYLR